MYKKLFTLIIIMQFVLSSNCQNLIPNGDIEGVQDMKVYKDWNATTAQWDCPHYSDTVMSPNGKAKQKIIFGNLKPHKGKAYIGIAYSELIHVNLAKNLDTGKIYCFSVYFNMVNKCYAKNQISISFFYLNLPNYEKTKLNYDIVSESVDSANWIRLCGTFKAKGSEKYLMVFNYNYTEKSKFKNKEMVFFDDFVLEPQKGSNECCPELLSAKAGDIITLKQLLFNTNSSIINRSSHNELNRLANYLKQNEQLKIQIIGYTDNTGNTQNNINLSKDRAKSVYVYLINKGIKDERMKFNGFGSSKPLFVNNTEDNKAKNRRVEIVFTK